MRSTLQTCYKENYPVMLTRDNEQSSLAFSRLNYRAAGYISATHAVIIEVAAKVTLYNELPVYLCSSS